MWELGLFWPSHYFCGGDHRKKKKEKQTCMPHERLNQKVRPEMWRKGERQPVSLGILRVSHPLACQASSFSAVCWCPTKQKTCLNINGTKTKNKPFSCIKRDAHTKLRRTWQCCLSFIPLGKKDGVWMFGKGEGKKKNMAHKEHSKFATGNQFIWEGSRAKNREAPKQ